MIHKTKSMKLALALLLSASVGTLAIAAPAAAQGQEQDNFDRYVNSGYNYCDAKLIGAVYRQDPYQGKLLIGQKIANGIGDNIPVILEESRGRNNSCDWADLPHSYEDAEVLAAFWSVGVEEAKAKAAALYTQTKAYDVLYVLNANERYKDYEPNGEGDFDPETDPALAAFFVAGFNYCDAKMVGAFFQQTPFEGKIFIGNKVKAGLIENVPWYIDRARQAGTACEWGELSYDYSDAERLSTMWNKDIEQTKSAIAELVTWGRSDIVDASLGR